MSYDATSETCHPLIGTSKVYFDQGNDRYSVEATGPRYLVTVKARPGRIGSIIVPDNYRPSETVGFIVGLGDGYVVDGKRVLPPLEIGAMVIFSSFAGSSVNLGDKEFRLLPYESVLGVLTPEGAVPEEDDD